jgi:hypothetical protein
MDSVEELLRHPTLKYHWVRYIPSEPIADDFWGRLQRNIVEELRSRPLFISESNNYLQPTRLRIISGRFRGSDKKPLLPNIGDGSSAYISEEYDHYLDVPVLRKLGTVNLAMDDFILRLQKDMNDNGNYVACVPRRWRVFGIQQSHSCLSQFSIIMSVSSNCYPLYRCRAEYGLVP